MATSRHSEAESPAARRTRIVEAIKTGRISEEDLSLPAEALEFLLSEPDMCEVKALRRAFSLVLVSQLGAFEELLEHPDPRIRLKAWELAAKHSNLPAPRSGPRTGTPVLKAKPDDTHDDEPEEEEFDDTKGCTVVLRGINA